jgi:hypothetical protein
MSWGAGTPGGPPLGRTSGSICAALREAPLKPATVLFEGDDPRAYIIASNIACRHMSKGQQAMAVAMMYPEPAKTKRKRSGSLEPKELGISGARIYSAASAGVSLTFINAASSVVLGYDLDLGSSAKLDFHSNRFTNGWAADAASAFSSCGHTAAHALVGNRPKPAIAVILSR